MKDIHSKVLTINGGSSSIKFAVFETADSPRRVREGGIEWIGLSEAEFVMKGSHKADNFTRSVTAANHTPVPIFPITKPPQLGQ